MKQRATSIDHSQIALWDGVMVPCSKLIDRVLGYLLDKSILAVWQKHP